MSIEIPKKLITGDIVEVQSIDGVDEWIVTSSKGPQVHQLQREDITGNGRDKPFFGVAGGTLSPNMRVVGYLGRWTPNRMAAAFEHGLRYASSEGYKMPEKLIPGMVEDLRREAEDDQYRNSDIYVPESDLKAIETNIKAQILPNEDAVQEEYLINKNNFLDKPVDLETYRLVLQFEYMGNFGSFFPDDKNGREVGRNRMILLEPGYDGITFGEWYAQLGWDTTGFSQRYLNQSAKDFLDTLDRVATHYKVDYDLIQPLNDIFGQARKIVIQKAMIWPVFVHMRGLHYSNKDLSALAKFCEYK